MKIVSYDPSSDSEIKTFYKEINKESDRGSAIISNAYIEDLLQKILKKRLIADEEIPNKIENLPVKQLISLCYATGTLTKEEKKDLITLNEIRNKFAHKRKITDFNHGTISRLCKDNLRTLGFKKELTIRQKFDVVVSYYIQILNLKLRQTNKIRLVEQEYPAIGMLETLLIPEWKEKK
jgi:hypothetical protein